MDAVSDRRWVGCCYSDGAGSSARRSWLRHKKLRRWLVDHRDGLRQKRTLRPCNEWKRSRTKCSEETADLYLDGAAGKFILQSRVVAHLSEEFRSHLGDLMNSGSTDGKVMCRKPRDRHWDSCNTRQRWSHMACTCGSNEFEFTFYKVSLSKRNHRAQQTRGTLNNQAESAGNP